MPIVGALAAGIAPILGDIGITGALGSGLATGLAGAGLGAAGGAALGAVTGTGAGRGALTGGLTGGVLGGVAPAVSGALGGGEAATLGTDVALGAGAGALGGKLTGGSPLSGAITGGVTGGVAGLTGVGSPTSTEPTATVSPTSASATSPGGAGSVGVGATSEPVLGSIPGGTPPGGAFMGALTDTTGGVGSGVAPTTGGSSGGPIASPGAAGFTGANQDFSAGGGTGSIVDNALSQLSANPLALLAGGGLLLESGLQKPASQLPEAQPLEASAARFGALGSNLTSFLGTGTLPPGAKTAVDAATQAEKANIRSSFGSMGLTGSTMEAEALSAADQHAAAETFNIGNQLLAEGGNFTNISDQLYQQILQETLQQDQAFQAALGNFAGGLAGVGMRVAATA